MTYDKKARLALTQAELKKLVKYDPKTGVMTRLVDGHTGNVSMGRRRVKTNVMVYRIGMTVKPYFSYPVSRLAWLYTHGEWPKDMIDHIDGDPLNNRLSNLRDVTCRQNCLNTTPHHVQV